MKTSIQILVLAALASCANAAITVNSSAPALNGADQGNMTWSTANSDLYWTDRPNPGQTFTTEGNAAGYELTSFSFQLNSTRTVAQTLTYNIRLVSVSGTTTSTLVQETGLTWDGVHNSGDWLTLTFSSPVTLSANTQYGVDLQHVSGGSWQNGITSIRRNGNTFAGGTRYTRVDGDPTTLSAASNDSIFHVNMTAIPEPSVALLSGLGVMLLLRRRKR